MRGSYICLVERAAPEHDGDSRLERRSATPAPAVRAKVLGGRALLVVDTEPSAVEVFVNGELVGETPLERSDLHAGLRRLELRHPHYETVLLRDQRLADDQVLDIEQTLTRARGGLTVLATPRHAWIEYDGERLAERRA